MDATDRKILRLLQADAQTSNRDLSVLVSLSEAQCSRRVAALYENGVIANKTIEVDRARTGLNFEALLAIILTAPQEKNLQRLTQVLAEIPEIIELDRVVGGTDLLARVLTESFESFASLYASRIAMVDGIDRIEVSVCLAKLKRYRGIPIRES